MTGARRTALAAPGLLLSYVKNLLFMLFGNNARSCAFSELGQTLRQPEKSHIRETLNVLLCADS